MYLNVRGNISELVKPLVCSFGEWPAVERSVWFVDTGLDIFKFFFAEGSGHLNGESSGCTVCSQY